MSSNSDYNITGKNISFITPNMMSPGGEINPKLADYFSLSESPWFHVVCGLLFLSTFVPQSRRLNRGLCYAIQVVAFLMGAVWVYTTHFGLTVFFVFFVMTSLSFVQTLYVLYHNKQTNLSPSFDKLYMELFRPLRMPLKEYKKLVQDPDVRLRSMAPGETYAIEGVSVPDQLSLLVSGCVHVSVEGKFIHKIDEFSFLDSPEWESFSEEFPEHFQVTLTAIRHSTYISWPRKVLEAILFDNPYLNATMTNLIGRDITNKLYLLNQRAATNASSRTPSMGGGTGMMSTKPSAKELRSIWSDASKSNLSGITMGGGGAGGVGVGVGGLKKPETGSLTALREMRSTERQNTFGDSSQFFLLFVKYHRQQTHLFFFGLRDPEAKLRLIDGIKTTEPTMCLPEMTESLQFRSQAMAFTSSSTVKRIKSGIWKQCSEAEKGFEQQEDALTILSGINFRGVVPFIPPKLRPMVIDEAHETHPGKNATETAVRMMAWWPGISQDVHRYRALMTHRNTSKSRGKTPVELLLGRKVRLPVVTDFDLRERVLIKPTNSSPMVPATFTIRKRMNTLFIQPENSNKTVLVSDNQIARLEPDDIKTKSTDSQSGSSRDDIDVASPISTEETSAVEREQPSAERLLEKRDEICAEAIRILKTESCPHGFANFSKARSHYQDLIKQYRLSKDCGNQTSLVSTTSTADKDPNNEIVIHTGNGAIENAEENAQVFSKHSATHGSRKQPSIANSRSSKHGPFSPPPGLLVHRATGATNLARSFPTGGLEKLAGAPTGGLELKDVLNSTTCMLQTALSNLNEAIGGGNHEQSGTSSLPYRKVTSGEGHSGSHDVSRSRTTTPHTHSTESDPINPTYSQNSLPVIRMHPEEDTVLTIRVPLTDKPIGSYDSPGSVPGTSRVLRSVTGSQPDMMSVRAPRYGDMQQSTSSSTEPSLSLDEQESSAMCVGGGVGAAPSGVVGGMAMHNVARRKARPLIRSKQIITEEENHNNNGFKNTPSSGWSIRPSPLANPPVTILRSNQSEKSEAISNNQSQEQCPVSLIHQIPCTTVEICPVQSNSTNDDTKQFSATGGNLQVTAQVHTQEMHEDVRNRPTNLPMVIEPEIVINPGTPTPDEQDSDLEYKWWSSLQQDSIDDPHYFVSLADMTGAPHSNHTTIEEEDPLIPCSSGSITTNNNNNISNSNNNINNVCRQQSQQEEQSPQPQSSPQVDNQQQCCVPSPRRGSRHNITEVIDLESMECDMLDPSSEIDEILKKAASSLASSRNSQTSDESPRRCSEEESSPGGINGGGGSFNGFVAHSGGGANGAVGGGLGARKHSIGIQVPHRRFLRGGGFPAQLSVDSGGSSAGAASDAGGVGGVGGLGVSDVLGGSGSVRGGKTAKVSRMLNQFNLGQTLDSSLSDSIATSMESDLNSAQGSNKRNSLSAFSRQNTVNSDVDLLLGFSCSRLSRQNSENSSVGALPPLSSPGANSSSHQGGQGGGSGSTVGVLGGVGAVGGNQLGSQNSLRSAAFSPIIPEELESHSPISDNRLLKAERNISSSRSSGTCRNRAYSGSGIGGLTATTPGGNRRKLRQSDRFSSVDTPSITITNAMEAVSSPAEEEMLIESETTKDDEGGWGEKDKLIPVSTSAAHRNKRFLPHGYSLD
ncbi:uncharacterized protein LOC142336542 [Convolutriloba macropyga]|uniref:uncharacterized protein LOC142336542 n=1 Tax=Convolutriloba macropyga TaxID=536237 RepID=UPI003F51E684